MLSTAVSILAAFALLMPGFIVAELSSARGARASRSDLELALRALAYTLVIHIFASQWTVWLVDRVGEPDAWMRHADEIVLYAVVVLLVVPCLLGVGAQKYIAWAERRDGQMPLLAAALGAGEARDAFDYAFQRLHKDGAYVIVELIGHSSDPPRLVGGVYGKRSAVGQTPAEHDIYLETLCTVQQNDDGSRSVVNRLEGRSMYIPASQIARIDVAAPVTDTLEA